MKLSLMNDKTGEFPVLRLANASEQSSIEEMITRLATGNPLFLAANPIILHNVDFTAAWP